MLKIAVFPGSFDPFTKGHRHLIDKILPLFDKVIIGIGNNEEKKTLFSAEERRNRIEKIFADEAKVSVEIYGDLTIDFCKRMQASYIVRGLRSFIDFEKEKELAQINKKLAADIETIFFVSDPEFAHISSSAYKELLKFKPEEAERQFII